jgi:hypothetical protein
MNFPHFPNPIWINPKDNDNLLKKLEVPLCKQTQVPYGKQKIQAGRFLAANIITEHVMTNLNTAPKDSMEMTLNGHLRVSDISSRIHEATNALKQKKINAIICARSNGELINLDTPLSEFDLPISQVEDRRLTKISRMIGHTVPMTDLESIMEYVQNK